MSNQPLTVDKETANAFFKNVFPWMPDLFAAEQEYQRVAEITLPIEAAAVATVYPDIHTSNWQEKHEKYKSYTPFSVIPMNEDDTTNPESLFMKAYAVYKANIAELQKDGTLPMCRGGLITTNDLSPMLVADSNVRDIKREIVQVFEHTFRITITMLEKWDEVISITKKAYAERIIK